jgi:hypothetical protein
VVEVTNRLERCIYGERIVEDGHREWLPETGTEGGMLAGSLAHAAAGRQRRLALENETQAQPSVFCRPMDIMRSLPTGG